MGICDNCKEKIMYNHYKRYRGKVLCPGCYSTRLERKAAKKAELKQLAAMAKIVTPKKKAKKNKKSTGLAITTGVMENEEGKTAEDSR